ncbi:MAG: hypothetical protein HOD92_23755 [Deltaproteobacteria bacterium]|nr:hypothetical protein [Deltaproteobacteria bacterium]
MSIMPKLIKKILVISIFYTLVILPDFCIAVENIAFGTGNPSSASWLFVDELSMDWQNVNLGNNTTLTTRYFESDAEKFKALQFRRLRFVIAPLNSISIKELKQRHLRIVSTLWNVYLAPMVITGTDSLRALNDYHNWYVPKGSRIMPLAFADEIIETSEPDQENNETDIEQGEEDYDYSNFSEPTTIEELIEQSQQFKTRPFDSPRIQWLDTALLEDSYFLNESDLLFFEMTGSVDQLIASLDYQVDIRALEPDFLNQLQEKIFWLEPFTLNIKNAQKIKTVGITMTLFTHEAESQEVVQQLLNLLMFPKKLYFPSGYIYKNVKTFNTKNIPMDALHDVSVIRFKKTE